MKTLERLAIEFFNLIDKFIHQPRILKFFKKRIKEINIFVDVGAHRGSYTDLIINNFKTRKALVFEPQDNIFQFLQEKYRLKQNIIIYNKALSEKKESSPAGLFQMFALYEHQVAVLDRKSFGSIGAEGKDYLRLSTASEIQILREGVQRLKNASQDQTGLKRFLKQRPDLK